MSWADVESKLDGRRLVRHVVLTFNGTWGADLVQYPGNVVNGLAEYVDDGLCYEVPVLYPAAFGPLGGALDAPSYAQSVQIAVDWASNWIRSNPLQTFVLGGYSQGAEAASRVLMELQHGTLTAFAPNFVGGFTFGNPCREAGSYAPGTADPGGRGISSTRIVDTPSNWADYVHSSANGDAGLDMYGSVPNGAVGDIMTDVYDTATALQFSDIGALTRAMVHDLTKIAYDSGLLGSINGGLTGLLGFGSAFILGMIEDAINAVSTTPTSKADAAGMAAAEGLKFLLAPGGPTAPHTSYLGEIGGYSNLVAKAVGFLHYLCTAVPARCAA